MTALTGGREIKYDLGGLRKYEMEIEEMQHWGFEKYKIIPNINNISSTMTVLTQNANQILHIDLIFYIQI